MRRRVGITVIIFAVYAAIFIIFDFVIPMFYRGFTNYGGFFPFFFFFPYIFGRGMRSRGGNTRNNSGPNQTDDELLNQNTDTSSWEYKNRNAYDEFGIPVRKVRTRTWYFVGMGIIFAASAALLFYRGILGF